MFRSHNNARVGYCFLIASSILFSLSSCDNKNLFPSDLYPETHLWSILLGDGTSSKQLTNFHDNDFFFTAKDIEGEWIVFKTPNSGVTSRTSSNTRSELGEINQWTPMQGGTLNATVKVQHATSSGNPSVPASFSVVIGQIHSVEGHENEPLKIFYRKYPNHKRGSVYWNYEINTKGSNDQRWDVSIPVWGDDMSVCSDNPDEFPKEPKDGIALGESFQYSISVKKGVMTLRFTHPNKTAKTFVKSLVKSTFSDSVAIPEQVKRWYTPLGRKGTELEIAYKGERQIFKIGAYNQSNGKSSSENLVWHTDAETYGGNIQRQYETGNYVEVWFKDISVQHPE
jgi:hypothetical protein|tara:strand:- start:19717 stop:20736 length:1020 start_codon:yes stop_codon:yes gene_type:complete